MAQTFRHPRMGGERTAHVMFAGRSSSLSSQIVADVRDALFAKKLKPGDFLGTEKDLAARFGVSRIVARDALRTLAGARHRRHQDGQGRRRARSRAAIRACSPRRSPCSSTSPA